MSVGGVSHAELSGSWNSYGPTSAMERACNSLWYRRVFALASATAGRQPNRRSLTCVGLHWCAEQSAAVRPLPASPESSGILSGRRLKAGAQAMLSGFILSQDSTVSRKMPSALTHPKAGETEVGGSGCGSEAAALAKLLLGVNLHH